MSNFLITALLTLSSLARGDQSTNTVTINQINIVKVCRKATADNFSGIFERGKYLSEAGDKYGDDTQEGPYLLSMFPINGNPPTGLRGVGIERQEKRVREMLAKKVGESPANLQDYFNQYSSGPMKYSQGHSALVKLSLEGAAERYSSYEAEGRLKLLKIWAPYECDPLGKGKCSDAFRELVDTMHPFRIAPSDVTSDNLSLKAVLTEVMTDDQYVGPISLFITRLYKKYHLAEQKQLSDPGNVYDDLIQAFKDSGFNQSQSEERTIKFLALYGTRGASAEPFFLIADNENAPIFASLAITASIISFLDGNYNPQFTYSLPPGIANQCDYTRPYHFWLAAYLSQHLLEQSYSDLDSLNAVHGVETAYERFGSKFVNNKDSMENVAGTGVHNYYDVETQKNIAFNDAGALWSIFQNSKRKLSWNIDETFLKMYNSSKIQTSTNYDGVYAAVSTLGNMLGGVDIPTLYQWKTKLAPEAALSDYRAAISAK